MRLHNILYKAAVALLLPLGGVGGGLLCSCTDWSDHYEDNGAAGSNTSLWEEIQSRPELSDFAKVLENTKVFRQHKKTAASYAEVLDGGQSFTVIAPINGTFDVNGLLEQVKTNAGDSAVEHFFIKNHITRTPRSAIESTFRMLNDKKVTMTSKDIWGVPFKDTNIRSKNGILHTVSQDLPYNKTIYETLTLNSEYSVVGEALKKYNEDEFNENASVQIGLVEGVPVYADSVIIEYNKMMNAVGLLNAEDSTYHVAIPVNDGWKNAWDVAKTYFNFDPNMDKRDSLQHYWTTRALLDDAIFSRTVQASMTDSIRSKWYDKNHPEYHVFYKPFEKDGLFGKSFDNYVCSNGTLYLYNEWPFTPTQTYFRKIELEGEYSWYIINQNNVSTMNTISLNADSISRGAFLDIASSGSNNWTATFKIDNTLSGKYDICVIVQPKTVTDPTNTKTKPTRFKATVNYLDENGNAVSKDLGSFDASKNRTDTVVVAKDFYLPVSNYDQNNDKVSLTLQSNVTQKQVSSYDRRMYLDCIIFKPKE